MNHRTLPPYAVVMPAHNAARTVEAAIESALAQTVAPDVIVVVDDGSTDATAEIVARCGKKVVLLQQENLGPAAATDRGIAYVDLPVIAGLDADDLWHPGKSERQLLRLADDAKLDAVFCRTVAFRHGTTLDLRNPARDLWGRSAMMIRRDSAEHIGPILDTSNPRGLGEMIRWIDLGRRLGLTFEMMPDALVGRRIIEGSLSFAKDAAGFLPMLRAKLSRPT